MKQLKLLGVFALLLASTLMSSCWKAHNDSQPTIRPGTYYYQVREIDLDSTVNFSPIGAIYIGTDPRATSLQQAPEAKAGALDDGCGSHRHHDCSLPVLWTFMTVTNKDTYIQVDFGTSYESNVDRFEIHRSSNGRDYYLAAIIYPTGPGHYTFKDTSPH